LAAHFVKRQDARAAKSVLYQLILLVRSRQLTFLWFDKEWEQEALHAAGRNLWIAPLHPTKPAHDDLKLDNKH
jgi:hypothetical protein